MSNQRALDFQSRYSPREDVGAPYAKGSQTSKDAAKKVAKREPLQRTEVYRAIVRSGHEGRTWPELMRELNLAPTSNGRVTRLVELGLVCDSGRTRKSRYGKDCTVWIAAPVGGER